MAKHTPGPWNVQPLQWDDGASLAIVAPNNGYIVAVVQYDEDIQTEDSPDISTVVRHPDEVPNAALIAAAPAMYEALQEALKCIEKHVPKTEFAPRQWIREVLAQAEGVGDGQATDPGDFQRGTTSGRTV